MTRPIAQNADPAFTAGGKGIMSDIAAMPMESSPDGFSGEDQDQVLYGGDEPL